VRTTIGDLPPTFPPPTPARVEEPAPATPEQAALMEQSPVVQAVLQGLLSGPFIGHLAQEVAFHQRRMALYPVTITPEDLSQGAILTQPVPVNGRALILTMLPLEPTQPDQPVHVVLVRHRPIPQAEMTGDPKADYLRGKLSVIVYRDHPFDLRKRQVVELGDLEAELHRQIWEVTAGQSTRPSSAFFYVSMVNVDPPANAEAPFEPTSMEGQANGRAG
jgi:hypothetical protein